MTTTRICPRCGKELAGSDEAGIATCPRCGVAGVPPSIPPTPDASALVPGIALPYGELQHAVTYLALTGSLRINGVIYAIQGVPMALITIPFFLFILKRIPGLPPEIPVMAVVFSVIGVINFVLGIFFLIPSPTSLLLLAISGQWDLYRRYKQLGPYLEHAPRPVMVQEAGALLMRITRGKLKRESDLLWLYARGNWRGLLQENLIILIHYSQRNRITIDDVRFLSPNEFTMTPIKRTLFGGLAVTCDIDDLHLRGFTSPEYFARYQAWAQRRGPVEITGKGPDLSVPQSKI